MLGLGAWELAMVLVVALVVLGPDKIPEVARKLARFVGQARRMAEDVRRNVDEALQEVQPPATPPASAFTDWLQRQQERGNEPPEGTQAAHEAPAPQEAGTESLTVVEGSTDAVAPATTSDTPPTNVDAATNGSASQPLAAKVAAAGAKAPPDGNLHVHADAKEES